MKYKQEELEVDFIGGGRPLTKEDEIAISNYIQAYKAKQLKKSSISKRAKRTLSKPLSRKRSATSSVRQHERITKRLNAIKKRRTL